MDIRVRGLRKTYGVSPALLGVDLDVASGELIGLLGPSGSGKTTLLRALAGLERPNAGTIHFGDVDMSGARVQDRRVGFVFQNYALFRHMTVAENVAYGLRARPRATRPPNAEIMRRVGDLLDLVQLAGFEARYPAQLSGGQRQRVALARALAVEPRVLLLDEPFGALDARVRKDLRGWLRDIHARTGHTTVFVTHDQEEALELSDRVAILNKGTIEQIGTPDEIYDFPASPFIYRFIGESNRVPVDLVDGVARVGDVVVGRANVAERCTGDLFFRPERASLGEGPGLLRATVLDIRRVGSSRRAMLRLDVSGATAEVDLPLAARLAVADRVGLRLDGFAAYVHGRRIAIAGEADRCAQRFA